MIKIKEVTESTRLEDFEKEDIFLLAIEGTEKDLADYLNRSSTVSRVYKELLEADVPIVLIPPESKEKRKLLIQYGRFLNRDNLAAGEVATKVLLFLKKKEGRNER